MKHKIKRNQRHSGFRLCGLDSGKAPQKLLEYAPQGPKFAFYAIFTAGVVGNVAGQDSRAYSGQFWAGKKPSQGTAKQVIRESRGHMSSLEGTVPKDKPDPSSESSGKSRASALRGT